MLIVHRSNSWAFALLLGACTNASIHGPQPDPLRSEVASEVRSVDQQPVPDAGASQAMTMPLAAADAAIVVATQPQREPPADVYPGSGFVLHEWGTNTVVVGSDGSLQRGLHHEGDDLPGFVYDRLKQAGSLAYPAVDKMETPVDYFYSDQPRNVTVRVDMPHGVLTQWYPAVSAFAPAVLEAVPGRTGLMDPLPEVHFAYASQGCSDKYTRVAAGMLDWGQVEILARELTPAAPLPDAPLEKYTWSYARQVAANTVRVRNPSGRVNGAVVNDPQHERFLFYRGLGNFAPPSRVTTTLDNARETIAISTPNAGPIFVLNVTATAAAFVRFDAMPNQASLETTVPDLNAGTTLDTFVETLAQSMTAALSSTGLYRDEATAMVNTWRHQWFRTPGVRVLYFAPSSWLDRELPITVTPAPDRTTRVMVMRVELLTHAMEQADVAAAAGLGSGATTVASRDHFLGLGRFAEPRLRRALELLASPTTGRDLLAEIEGPNVAGAVGQ
jgi:hypothetical protein